VKTSDKLIHLRRLMLEVSMLAAELADDDSLINAEDVSNRIDMAYIALDDVRAKTIEDLQDWAAERADERRAA